MIYTCANCGFSGPRDNFDDAVDLFQRLAPGGIYTDKECPLANCGALAFPEGEDLQ